MILQDPFCVFTRQLHSPDLDCLIAQATFLFGLQMHHAVLRALLLATFGLLAVNGAAHGCVSEALQCEEGVEVGEDMLEESGKVTPRKQDIVCEEGAQPRQQSHRDCLL